MSALFPQLQQLSSSLTLISGQVWNHNPPELPVNKANFGFAQPTCFRSLFSLSVLALFSLEGNIILSAHRRDLSSRTPLVRCGSVLDMVKAIWTLLNLSTAKNLASRDHYLGMIYLWTNLRELWWLAGFCKFNLTKFSKVRY